MWRDILKVDKFPCAGGVYGRGAAGGTETAWSAWGGCHTRRRSRPNVYRRDASQPTEIPMPAVYVGFT